MGGGHTPEFGHTDKGTEAAAGSGPDLSDAAPQGTGTAAAGVSADASRADHVHAVTFGATVGSAPGTASNGSGTEPARANHVHPPLIRKIITFGGQNLPANTNTTVGRFNNFASHFNYTAIRGGTVTGIACSLDAVTTGSALVIQVAINGVRQTAGGQILTVALGAQFGYVVLASPIAYVAGDRIAAYAITDASWTGTTLDPDIEFELTEVA